MEQRASDNRNGSGDAATSGNGVRSFFRGAAYPLRGWRLARQHPKLLRLCVAPTLVTVLLLVVIFGALWMNWTQVVGLLWPRPQDSWLRPLWYVLSIVMIGAVLVVAYCLFFIGQSLLLVPFTDALSERTEQILRGSPPPQQPLLQTLWSAVRGVGHQTVNLTLYAAILGPMFLLSVAVPVPGTFILGAAGAYATALFCGFDMLDLSMARRNWTLRKRWNVVRQNRMLVLGFGSAASLALAVPVLNLVAPPLAAIGATMLFVDLEQNGAIPEA